jgi:hypothetical protein
VTRSRRGPEVSLRRRLAPICIAGLLLTSLGCASLASAASPSFCHERFVRDYAAPLSSMPRQHPPPEGELPFGPRNFGIHRIGRTPLSLDGGHFGYRFGGKNEGARVLDLSWRATAVARSVDARGRVRHVVGERRWRADRIKDLDALEIAFPADHPGYYRVDLRIGTLDGRRRVAYRDYFRVLRRSDDFGIKVSAVSARPGESVWGALVNPGAGQIATRSYLDLERAEGDGWVRVPAPPSPGSVMAYHVVIGPGEAGLCQRFDVPADAIPGSYRFSAPVNLDTGKRIRVTGPFEIAP